jgi:hypothetical protein
LRCACRAVLLSRRGIPTRFPALTLGLPDAQTLGPAWSGEVVCWGLNPLSGSVEERERAERGRFNNA